METTAPSQSSVVFKWVIFSALTSIILTYAFQFMGTSQVSPVKYISLIPYIAFMVLAQIEYRKALGGFMSYGQGFMTGFLYALYNGIISLIFMFLYFKILSPGAYEQTLQGIRDGLAAKNLTEDQQDAAMAMYKNYGVLIFSVSALIGGIFAGTIISLITAAILKKERTLIDIERENNYQDPLQ